MTTTEARILILLKKVYYGKIKQIPCVANPEFMHTTGKSGIKAMCGQCGLTLEMPKTFTDELKAKKILKLFE